VFGGLQKNENTQQAPILGSATLLLLCHAEGGPNFTTCVVTKYETNTACPNHYHTPTNATSPPHPTH